MNIISVHGNSADPSSFHFIDGHLDAYTRTYISYDSSNGFVNNLHQMKNILADVEDDVILIGHSLGGLYCLFLSAFFGERCKGAISLATPFGGCEYAGLMSLFSNKRVLRDVAIFGTVVTAAKRITFEHPWIALISMKGRTHSMLKMNDGFVSHDSMTCRDDMLHIEVGEDHYSILESSDVIDIMLRFIKRACKGKKSNVVLTD